jgi:hypothetical protein
VARKAVDDTRHEHDAQVISEHEYWSRAASRDHVREVQTQTAYQHYLCWTSNAACVFTPQCMVCRWPLPWLLVPVWPALPMVACNVSAVLFTRCARLRHLQRSSHNTRELSTKKEERPSQHEWIVSDACCRLHMQRRSQAQAR